MPLGGVHDRLLLRAHAGHEHPRRKGTWQSLEGGRLERQTARLRPHFPIRHRPRLRILECGRFRGCCSDERVFRAWTGGGRGGRRGADRGGLRRGGAGGDGGAGGEHVAATGRGDAFPGADCRLGGKRPARPSGRGARPGQPGRPARRLRPDAHQQHRAASPRRRALRAGQPRLSLPREHLPGLPRPGERLDGLARLHRVDVHPARRRGLARRRALHRGRRRLLVRAGRLRHRRRARRARAGIFSGRPRPRRRSGAGGRGPAVPAGARPARRAEPVLPRSADEPAPQDRAPRAPAATADRRRRVERGPDRRGAGGNGAVQARRLRAGLGAAAAALRRLLGAGRSRRGAALPRRHRLRDHPRRVGDGRGLSHRPARRRGPRRGALPHRRAPTRLRARPRRGGLVRPHAGGTLPARLQRAEGRPVAGRASAPGHLAVDRPRGGHPRRSGRVRLRLADPRPYQPVHRQRTS